MFIQPTAEELAHPIIVLEMLEEQERTTEAYDQYRKAAWNGSAVAKAMVRAACIALKQGSQPSGAASAEPMLDFGRKTAYEYR